MSWRMKSYDIAAGDISGSLEQHESKQLDYSWTRADITAHEYSATSEATFCRNGIVWTRVNVCRNTPYRNNTQVGNHKHWDWRTWSVSSFFRDSSDFVFSAAPASFSIIGRVTHTSLEKRFWSYPAASPRYVLPQFQEMSQRGSFRWQSNRLRKQFGLVEQSTRNVLTRFFHCRTMHKWQWT